MANTIPWEQLPYQKSFNLLQGDSLIWPVHFRIKAEAATSYSDLSFTGCTLTLNTKKGSAAVTTSTVTPDVAASGKVSVLATAATTGAWTDEVRYELQVVFPTGHTNFPSGATRTLLEGVVRVKTDLA